MPTQQKQFPPTSVIAVSKIQMADAMAASSGGIEWSVIIKSFLSPQHESCSKIELLEVCSAIVKRYILRPADDRLGRNFARFA